MGTWVDIQFEAPRSRAQRLVRAAYLQVERVQRRMSFQDPHSVLSFVNRCAHREPQTVDRLTWAVLRKSMAMWRASGGLFDVSVGAALVGAGVLPDHGFSARPAQVGSDAVVLLPGRRVYLRRPVLLTLDGIAKGEAVDRAIACLRRFGAVEAVVNAGGDLRQFGQTPLPVTVQGPRGERRALTVLHNTAVAASISGSDEALRDRFPARLVRPTSASLHCHARQMSDFCAVQASQCWRADALTKVALLAPRDEVQRLIHRLGGRLVGSWTASVNEGSYLNCARSA